MAPPEAIKVLYVHHGARPVGGSPTSLRFQIEELDKTRFAPAVALLGGSRAAPAFEGLGIPVMTMPGVAKYGHTTGEWYRLSRPLRLLGQHLRLPLSIAKSRAFLSRLEGRPIVHLNSSTLLPVALAARQVGLPVVWHIREYMVDGYLGLRRRALSYWMRKCASHIIAISRADLERIHGFESVRADVVYNFVDFERFDRRIRGEAVRDELGLDSNRRTVVFLGGVSPIKGTIEYLRAARALARKRKDVQFILAGSRSRFFDGPLRARRLLHDTLRPASARYYRAVRDLLKDKDLSKAVLDVGPRSDIPEVLAAGDLLVFPSTAPHFARPLIEAGAMGKPVIGSNLPGPQEIVVDGETGLLVPPGAPEALAAAMERILDDPEKARAMGDKGCERARDLFDAKKNVRRIEAIYEEVMACR